MIHDSNVDVAATLPACFNRSQGSFGSDLGSNQLGVITHNGIGSNQGEKGIGPYRPLSGGLEGSPTYIGVGLNTWGWGGNTLMSPSGADTVSNGVQVSLSLFPSVRCCDRRASIDNAQSPTPVQWCLRPPPRIKKPRQLFVRNDNICRGWWTVG